MDTRIFLTSLFVFICGYVCDSYSQTRIVNSSQKAKTSQNNSKTASGRFYVSLRIFSDEATRIPIYSSIGVEKKLSRVLTSQNLYRAEKANTKGSQMWYKLYTLEGNYLGYISNLYFNQCPAPVAPVFEMIKVEGGTFMMGDNSVPSSSPIHEVTVSDFEICKFEVTPYQWIQVFGKKSNTRNISWEDAQNFIKIVNKLTKKNYRLPTEAEWEYAAKGGKYSKGFKYSGSNNINDVAWYNKNSDLQGTKMMKPGLKMPNELGLYDMSGNLWEYCQDSYNYYPEDSQVNPLGKNNKTKNIVIRGGGAVDDADCCLVTTRKSEFRDYGTMTMGFRLVLDSRPKSNGSTKKKSNAQ